MSNTELERFNVFLGTNDAARKQAAALRGNADALLRLASDNGFSLKRADFELMSDDELDGVTGGSGIPIASGDKTVSGF